MRIRTGLFTLLFICFGRILLLAQEDTLLYNKATRLFDTGEFEEAEALFSDYLGSHPNSADAYFERGKCLINLKKFKKAKRDMNMAIKLDSTFSEAYTGRGMLFARKKQNKEALSDFNNAIRLDSLDCEAFNNRGVYYLFQKEYKLALVDLLNAVRIGKKNNELQNYFLLNLSDAYCSLGNYEEAINAANDAIELNPTIGDGYLRRGDAYEKLGKQEEADRDFKKATTLESQRVYNAH